MIVRELKDHPEEVLAVFDWFNDYKDTRLWAQFECSELVPSLDKGHQEWLENIHERWRQQREGC